MALLPLDDCARLGHPNVTGAGCPCGAETCRQAPPLEPVSFHHEPCSWWANEHARDNASRYGGTRRSD